MNALSLACAMVLAILAHTTLAQNSQQDYINAHNKARAAVGVGNVSWNNTVQQYAQKYANSRKGDCKLMHSSGSPYGENLYGGPVPDPSRFTGLDAMNAWVDEKKYYDYNTNSCANGQQCGHYTQVVWRNSNQIGCARVVCDNNSGIFIICSYYPRGNYIGQKPY